MSTNQTKRERDQALLQRIFDPSVPDWTFLSQEELASAFGIAERALRKWSEKRAFPEPVAYPGFTAYPVGAVRAFLKRQGEFAVSSFKSKTKSAVKPAA